MSGDHLPAFGDPRHTAAYADDLDLVAMEEEARALLPAGVYDYFAGGADDELTLTDNVMSWRALRLRPRILRDVTSVDTTTTVLGHRVATPIGVAPTAFHRLAHPDAEPATARGAAAAGAAMVVSTRATTSFADVAAGGGDWSSAPGWFQVYVLRNRSLTVSLVGGAVASGCTALVLTGDTPMLGRRLRDAHNRFVLPADIGAASLDIQPGDDVSAVDQDPSATFDTIQWLAELSGLPVVVKGVMRGDDAVACLDAGAAAVWVSNHGGRQLDGAVSTAEALDEVVAAVDGRGEVYVDGGIRRGLDVLSALAMGARAVFLGRPVLWGLATGGAGGVEAVLEGLRLELARAMALTGAVNIGEITPDLLARR